ncbi:hypothetical protein DL89DRAFT_158481 [Linderina pennispora]|uniref:Uncharacterized protein n=1 Tax=Linderina pennispora TaxID=61395 RepID=A0A1Y1VUV2_9FUNG|nr:uncharacterized protein DL89DRAFT_158481 [Linderina pennispora]ORX64796.1 hypothetical protein DL89DRAFT_158481 [Linderina pennispora]
MGYLSARESQQQQQQQQGHLANGVCVNISSACSEIAPCLECSLSLNRYPRRCCLLSRLRSSRLSMPAPAALWCTRLCCFICLLTAAPRLSPGLPLRCWRSCLVCCRLMSCLPLASTGLLRQAAARPPGWVQKEESDAGHGCDGMMGGKGGSGSLPTQRSACLSGREQTAGASRGQQRPAEASRGQQRPAEASRGQQRPAGASRGQQRPAEASSLILLGTTNVRRVRCRPRPADSCRAMYSEAALFCTRVPRERHQSATAKGASAEWWCS